MNPATAVQPDRSSRSLAHLPVSAFATVMGLGGTALAWQRAAATLHVSPIPGRILAWHASVRPVRVGVHLPLAALTSAFLTATRPGAAAYRPAAVLALAVLSTLVVALIARTLIAVRRGQFCRAEPPAGDP